MVMIGDTPYDSEAAAKVGVQTIAFRSGGWSDEDLTKAIAVYDGPADLLAHYETSVFVTRKETRNDSPQNVAQGGQDETTSQHTGSPALFVLSLQPIFVDNTGRKDFSLEIPS